MKPDTLVGDWVPQATLSLPTSVLEENCGLHFTDGYDDFDLFQGTQALSVNGHRYMLRHYRGDGPGVDIYLPFEVDDRREIAATIAAVLKQLHLPREVIAWERVPPSEA